MSTPEHPTEALLRACGLTPGELGGARGAQYTYVGPGKPMCPDCGVPVVVGFKLIPGGSGLATVAHPVPICPEFARRLEEIE